jgi:hypothetical protein
VDFSQGFHLGTIWALRHSSPAWPWFTVASKPLQPHIVPWWAYIYLGGTSLAPLNDEQHSPTVRFSFGTCTPSTGSRAHVHMVRAWLLYSRISMSWWPTASARCATSKSQKGIWQLDCAAHHWVVWGIMHACMCDEFRLVKFQENLLFLWLVVSLFPPRLAERCLWQPKGMQLHGPIACGTAYDVVALCSLWLWRQLGTCCHSCRQFLYKTQNSRTC